MATQYASQQPSGFSNHVKNIAIVGAAGQVGKFIVDALLAKKTFTITAISREGSASKPDEGVKVASVNYDKPDTIVNALKGQDALIITMSVRAPSDQQAKLIEAAAKAGVPWVLPNEFGSSGTDEQIGRDVAIGPAKQKDRQLIESLGVSNWIGVCCMFWYEYSLAGPGLYGVDIAKREMTFFDDGTQRINTSTWPQTGRAVAQLLSLPILPEDENDKRKTLSSYRNKFAFVSSFTLNQREMFDAVKRVTSTTDSDWKINTVPAKQRFEEAKVQMQAGNPRAFPVVLYTRFFFPGDNAGLYEVTEGLDNDDLGLPQEDLDEFTREAVRLAESGYFAKIFGSG